MLENQTEKEPSDILCEKIIERIYPKLLEQLKRDIKTNTIIKELEHEINCGRLGKIIKNQCLRSF